MRNILCLILGVVVICGLAYGAEEPSYEMATEPVGAVVQTFGFFVGRLVNVVDEAATGKKAITVESSKGEQKVFPFAQTVKLTDKTFNAITLNQLKKDSMVSVEYKEGEGPEEATVVMVHE